MAAAGIRPQARKGDLGKGPLLEEHPKSVLRIKDENAKGSMQRQLEPGTDYFVAYPTRKLSDADTDGVRGVLTSSLTGLPNYLIHLVDQVTNVPFQHLQLSD